MTIFFNKNYDETITGGNLEPWLTRDSITVLSKILKSNFIGLEWGCGSSTVWFCEKIKFLYTIEHNKEWAEVVEKYINEERIDFINKWKLFLIEEDEIYCNNQIYLDCNRKSRKEYVLAENVPNNLDFICIDGRARVGCINTAVLKIKEEGGVLVLDNSERKEYYPNSISNGWEKIKTDNGVWKTTIWISKK